MKILIPGTDALGAAAREFVEHIGDHRVFAFYGAMGAGKTTFIKAVCEELGVVDQVTSPTFAIVNEYECGSQPSTLNPQLSTLNPQLSTLNPQLSTLNPQPSTHRIYHFDFYRIKRLEEAYDMGCEEYFYSGNLCFIEWPEMIEGLLPDDAVRVDISEQPDGQRLLSAAEL